VATEKNLTKRSKEERDEDLRDQKALAEREPWSGRLEDLKDAVDDRQDADTSEEK
jgi:hypothetical protein